MGVQVGTPTWARALREQLIELQRRFNNTAFADSWQPVGNFANGWGSSSPTFQFRLSNDQRSVLLTGQASVGTTTADGTTIAVLPVGYRPLHNQWIMARRDNSVTYNDGAFRIDSSGNIACYGVTTSAPATTNMSVNSSFPIDT